MDPSKSCQRVVVQFLSVENVSISENNRWMQNMYCTELFVTQVGIPMV